MMTDINNIINLAKTVIKNACIFFIELFFETDLFYPMTYFTPPDPTQIYSKIFLLLAFACEYYLFPSDGFLADHWPSG